MCSVADACVTRQVGTQVSCHSHATADPAFSEFLEHQENTGIVSRTAVGFSRWPRSYDWVQVPSSLMLPAAPCLTPVMASKGAFRQR